MKNNFYQLTNQDENNAELYIYGDITSYKWYEDEVCAYDMAKELAQLGEKDLSVRINSYGGEVAQGLAIYNLLKNYKGTVTTLCDGFACSAASVIFMAGTERKMPRSSLLMIHNAWTYAAGDSNTLRKAADDIEKITQPSVEIYKSCSSLSEEQIKEMMDREEWITADEAHSYGFATEIVEDTVKQSLHDGILAKLVLKNKELEKQLNNTQPLQKKGWFFKCQKTEEE